MSKVFRKGFAVFVLIMLMILLSGIFVVTKPGEYRVIKQFGKVVRIEENTDNSLGLSFKLPFVQSETSISSKIHFYDLAPSDVMTSDKKSMISDCFVTWRISDPLKFTQQLGASVSNAESRISSNVYNALKTVLSSLTQEEVISGRDGELATMIRANVGDKLLPYGINVLDIETKMLDLPDENKQAVYTRMISERDNMAATFTAQGKQQAQEIMNNTDEEVKVILANAQKEADTIIAEGQAEYMRILSEAYNDPAKAEFYSFVRQLDAMEKTLQTGTNKIVLDKNSPVTELFY